MLPDPLSSQPQPKFSQVSVRRTAIALSSLTVLLALVVPYAKAGPLDQLSQTLTQTATSVTNQVLNPINQVQGVVNSTIGQVESTINQTVGGILGPIQNATGISFSNPFQSLLQTFATFIQNALTNLFGGITAGGSQGSGEVMPDISLNNPVVQIPQGPGLSNRDLTHVGALGLPDIQTTHRVIDQMAIQTSGGGNSGPLQKSDRFNSNPQALAYSIKSNSDRTASRGVAETVIGTTGQQQMAKDAQAASQALQFIQQTATAAQSKDVTQDVMKDLTAMTSAQSSLVSGSYAQLMGLRTQTAANSVVTNNISEAMDEANRMHHAERMGAAMYVLNSAANFYMPGQEK